MLTGPKIPVTVLTGFLGSGKTTLLNALLGDPAFVDTAVIVNELGEIGLDDLLITAVEDNIVMLGGGCLCCGLNGTLRDTLMDLNARRVQGAASFARIMVETTGLADPAPILQSLLRDRMITDTFAFDRLVTVVDAVMGERELDEQPEARQQAALADRLVLTKLDIADPGAAERIERRLRQINPAAPILHADKAAPAHAIFGDGAAGRSRIPFFAEAMTQASHQGDVRADSFVIEGPVHWAGVAGWTDMVTAFFGAQLLRCKGLLKVEGAAGPVLVQGVQDLFAPPQTLAAWPSDDHRSRLVCISKGLDRDLLVASLPTLHIPPGAFRPATVDEMLAANA